MAIAQSFTIDPAVLDVSLPSTQGIAIVRPKIIGHDGYIAISKFYIINAQDHIYSVLTGGTGNDEIDHNGYKKTFRVNPDQQKVNITEYWAIKEAAKRYCQGLK